MIMPILSDLQAALNILTDPEGAFGPDIVAAVCLIESAVLDVEDVKNRIRIFNTDSMLPEQQATLKRLKDLIG